MSSADFNSSPSTQMARVADRASDGAAPQPSVAASDTIDELLREIGSEETQEAPADGTRQATAPEPDVVVPDFGADSTTLSWWRTRGRRATAGATLSLLVHAAVLFGLSLLFTVVHVVQPRVVIPLEINPRAEQPRDEITTWVAVPQELGDRFEYVQPASTLPVGDLTVDVAPPAISFPNRELTRTARWIVGPPRKAWLPDQNWLNATGAAAGGGLEGRLPDVRPRMLSAWGGTPESEAAVERGLAWLSSAQLHNGAWHFNHHAGPLRGKCSNPGSVVSTTGATALGLLPFLGAGITPDSDSPHALAVTRGLNYLLSRQHVTLVGSDLQEGTMYAQGLATLALCESYAMTGNSQLGEAAQRAIDFICYAQHEEGGWRYTPGQPGDITVTGWQLMALKSGQMAQLEVPTETVVRATQFLTSLQSDEGASYGYLEPGQLPSPTAIGLLMRMYTGWSRDDPRLARGVAYVAGLGPSHDDLYFNYYATQLLHHYDGPQWDAWNEEMRQMLIRTQAKEGAERGSWFFADRHGAQGGRHYNTAMAIMILEVYYRYMPLYTESSVIADGQF